MEASQLSLDEVSRLFRQFEDRHRLELTPTVVLCQYCYAQLPLKDLADHWFLDHSSPVTQVTLNGDDDRCSGHEWTTTLQYSLKDPFCLDEITCRSIVSLELQQQHKNGGGGGKRRLMIHWASLTLAKDLFVGWISHAEAEEDPTTEDTYVVKLMAGDEPKEVVATWAGTVLPLSPYFDLKEGFTFTRTDLCRAAAGNCQTFAVSIGVQKVATTIPHSDSQIQQINSQLPETSEKTKRIKAIERKPSVEEWLPAPLPKLGMMDAKKTKRYNMRSRGSGVDYSEIEE